jgi:hypothetical protein
MSQPTASTAPPPKRRGFGSTGDMVRSSLVVLAIVIGFVALVPRPDTKVTSSVDLPTTAAQAERVAPYPVLTPEGLDAGWRPTRAEVRRESDGTTTWRVGFTTPEGKFVRLVQSDRPAEAFVAAEAGAAQSEGSRPVAGEDWQLLTNAEEERRAMWSSADASTVVLTGTTSYDELAELAESLR